MRSPDLRHTRSPGRPAAQPPAAQMEEPSNVKCHQLVSLSPLSLSLSLSLSLVSVSRRSSPFHPLCLSVCRSVSLSQSTTLSRHEHTHTCLAEEEEEEEEELGRPLVKRADIDSPGSVGRSVVLTLSSNPKEEKGDLHSLH